jgi:ribose transport system ATP-binding protein
MAHQSLLSMQAITKDFPGVRALNHVSFTLEAGQVHGLLGANGAGKSTLIKVLGGLFDDYSGQILLDGEEVNIRSPRQAAAAGIALIHQEFNLHPQLTVAENILLGREPLRKIAGVPFLNWRQLYAQAEEFLTEIGFDLPIREKVGDLGVAGQQLVQIAKALVQKARILVMDEPTARLSSNEREDLFRVIKRLKTSGVGIIYISHFIEEVFMIADQITVLRDGQVVVSKPSPELDHRTVVNLMVGREVSQTPVDAAPPADTPVLEVEHFSSASGFSDVSFTLYKGEILGLAGLVGAGRTELARALFGASSEPLLGGNIRLGGTEYRPKSPRDAIARGLALLPEDRKHQGLVLQHSVAENISLTVLDRLVKGPFIDHSARAQKVKELIEMVEVKASSPDAKVSTLSGGNQQKTVLGKWLAVRPDILIMDQPTAGIDVGTKAEIYKLMEQLVAEGMSLIVISDEPEELARVCHRILVMRKGRVVNELNRPFTSEEVLAGVTAEY